MGPCGKLGSKKGEKDINSGESGKLERSELKR